MIEEADTYIRFYSITAGLLVIINKYGREVTSLSSACGVHYLAGRSHETES